MLGIGFPIPGAITTDHEEFSREAPRRRWSLDKDVGDGLGGALGFGTWILLQDGEYGVIVELMNLHHVDC
jgi:hypothetical protein